jgi:hypothetical protein
VVENFPDAAGVATVAGPPVIDCSSFLIGVEMLKTDVVELKEKDLRGVAMERPLYRAFNS